jgi:H+-transporting ATPase
MAIANGNSNGDLEKGNLAKELQRESEPNDDVADLGEYPNLVRYISTYHDGEKPVEVNDDDEKLVKCPWWTWNKESKTNNAGAGFETPPEWLQTDMMRGLTSAEVEIRRKKTGWNELTTEKENLWLKFVGFFMGPILYGRRSYSYPHSSQPSTNSEQVMWLAFFLSIGLRDWIDMGVIAGILFLNAVVGWYQEKQAHDVVQSLKGDIAMKSMVIREGQVIEIKARDLVPGDIVSFYSYSQWAMLNMCRSSSTMEKLSLPTLDSSAPITTPLAMLHT